MHTRIGLALFATLLGLPASPAPAVSVGDLRCEYAANPLGIDALPPRLSWILTSRERNQHQSAYHVHAFSTEENLRAGKADLWDTGRVASSESIQIPWGGATLTSRQRVYWRVRVWDAKGEPTPFSEPVWFEMGLLKSGDWKAAWIGYPGGWTGRALLFRNELRIPKPVRQARVYVAGLGYYELRVNGTRVGDSVLDPGWTDYSKRVLYAAYDVTAMLREGRNALGVMVGTGWYGMPKLLLQMEVRYDDGTGEAFFTHGGHAAPTWRATGAPVLANSIYDGETYDANLEKTGWDTPEGAKIADRTEGWAVAVQVEPPGGRMVAQMVEPIRVVDTLRPVKMSEPKPGIAVFDSGQNLAGWAELRVSGARGTRVTLRFSENLNEDGTVNQDNLRTAAATDSYILKGGGRETWQPRFTYHGFRYVQVEGLPEPPTLDSIAVKVVRTSVAPNGKFESSNDLVNRIHKMVWWTEASNMHGIPTDCPQRDERHGWMNDLTVRLDEALYNFQIPRFTSKFLDDVTDTQDANGAISDTIPFRWGFQPADPVSASYLLLGWMSYKHYGDRRNLEKHYAGFQRWTDYLNSRAKDGILRDGRYGDWSPPAAFANGPTSKNTPAHLMSTGYLYYCARMVAQMAEVLDKPSDRQRYSALADRIAAAFQREYWNEAASGYGTNNMAANSFALFLGIVPKERVPRVAENLAKDVVANNTHLTTGNLCTKYVLEMLVEHGRADLAFDLVTQTSYPSWGFMLVNGATTLWERWEHLTGGQMNSHNHPMMGSVGSWFYKYLAGINADPRGSGFQRIVLKPYPVQKLEWVRGEYTTPYGPVRSQWSRHGGTLTYSIVVPVNTTATVWIPNGNREIAQSAGVKWLRDEGGYAVAEAGSGEYEFTVKQ